ncbi:MAG: iron ABC transporter permease [Brumimicrobium sp.]
MVSQLKYNIRRSIVLLLLLLAVIIFDLSLGSMSISYNSIFKGIFNYNPEVVEELTVRIFRIPRVVTAVLAGMALSVSGLLMQTLFQNPLAGPYVLGINSGASLMVGLSTMTGFHFFSNDLGIVASALVGAFGAGLFILFCSVYVRTKVSLLLVGIMFGSFAGALVNVVQSYSNPDDLKTFMLWSFGSLQNVQFDQLGFLTLIVLIGIFLTLFLVKPLNLLVLGDTNASFLGVKIKTTRFFIIFVTAILVGTITAFCGPIAFVGLIVPNIVKMIYKTTNHFHLLIGTLLAGALMIVFCDILMQLFQPIIHLPLNALTALMGAPIVVWIIIKRF